jgi:hypothetical protein
MWEHGGRHEVRFFFSHLQQCPTHRHHVAHEEDGRPGVYGRAGVRRAEDERPGGARGGRGGGGVREPLFGDSDRGKNSS